MYSIKQFLMQYLNRTMFVLLLCVYQLVIAQRNEIPTLYFKNGDTLQGERHTFLKDQIQFLKTPTSKFVKYDFDDLIKVEVMNKKSNEVTTYVRTAVVGKKRKLTLELAEEGFLSYFRSKNYTGTDGTFFYNFYLKRKGENAITFVGSQNPLQRGFKKRITAYLNDCDALVQKIKTKEFKRRHIKEIVRDYNENCIEK